ncbi:morphogenic membrane protein MmpB [Streptomyces sp. NPDC059740]
MLWSEPPDEPPPELRETQAMLRRVGVVVAVAAVVAMLVLLPGL